jgi:hypothetical protein
MIVRRARKKATMIGRVTMVEADDGVRSVPF